MLDWVRTDKFLANFGTATLAHRANYIESQSETGDWRFGPGFGGTSGGSSSEIRFRAKTIAWK